MKGRVEDTLVLERAEDEDDEDEEDEDVGASEEGEDAAAEEEEDAAGAADEEDGITADDVEEDADENGVTEDEMEGEEEDVDEDEEDEAAIPGTEDIAGVLLWEEDASGPIGFFGNKVTGSRRAYFGVCSHNVLTACSITASVSASSGFSVSFFSLYSLSLAKAEPLFCCHFRACFDIRGLLVALLLVSADVLVAFALVEATGEELEEELAVDARLTVEAEVEAGRLLAPTSAAPWTTEQEELRQIAAHRQRMAKNVSSKVSVLDRIPERARLEGHPLKARKPMVKLRCYTIWGDVQQRKTRKRQRAPRSLRCGSPHVQTRNPASGPKRGELLIENN